MRVAADHHMGIAKQLVTELAPEIGSDIAELLVSGGQRIGSEIRQQRSRVAELKKILQEHHQ